MSAGLIALTALAGGVGSALRFTVDALVTSSRHGATRGGISLGTIVVNVTACLLLGILTGWASAVNDMNSMSDMGGAEQTTSIVSVLGVGLLGGYSTFSTASVETARLLLEGNLRGSVVHAAGMLLVCLGAGVAGLTLGGWLA